MQSENLKDLANRVAGYAEHRKAKKIKDFYLDGHLILIHNNYTDQAN